MKDDDLIRAMNHRIDNPLRRIDPRLVPPARFPPASPRVVEASEMEMGVRFPELLRMVYQEVGNGGFGPGYGLLGLRHGYSDEGTTLEGRYAEFTASGLPAALLPLWDWGCGAWACLDWTDPEWHIVTEYDGGPTRTTFTLRSWLESWLADVDLWEASFEYELKTLVSTPSAQQVEFRQRGEAKGTPWVPRSDAT